MWLSVAFISFLLIAWNSEAYGTSDAFIDDLLSINNKIAAVEKERQKGVKQASAEFRSISEASDEFIKKTFETLLHGASKDLASQSHGRLCPDNEELTAEGKKFSVVAFKNALMKNVTFLTLMLRNKYFSDAVIKHIQHTPKLQQDFVNAPYSSYMLKKQLKNKSSGEALQVLFEKTDGFKIIAQIALIFPMILFLLASIIAIGLMFGLCFPLGLIDPSPSKEKDKNMSKEGKKSKKSAEVDKKKKKTAETLE